MLCFSALCQPTKRKNQLKVEQLKQKRGIGIVDENGTISFGRVHSLEESESEEDEEEDEV